MNWRKSLLLCTTLPFNLTKIWFPSILKVQLRHLLLKTTSRFCSVLSDWILNHIFIIQDGEYKETTPTFKVMYEDTEAFLKELLVRRRKRRKADDDDNWCVVANYYRNVILAIPSWRFVFQTPKWAAKPGRPKPRVLEDFPRCTKTAERRLSSRQRITVARSAWRWDTSHTSARETGDT